MSIIKNTEELNNLLDAVQKLPVKKDEQEKVVDITENGTTEVTPDEGKALSKVTVNVAIESGGGGTEEIENLIDESKVLDSTDGTATEKVEQLIDLAEDNNWFRFAIENNTQNNGIDLFGGYTGTKVPYFGTLSSKNTSHMFYGGKNILSIDFYIDCPNSTSGYGMFYGTSSMKYLKGVNCANMTTMVQMFRDSGVEVIEEPLNVPNVTNFVSAFDIYIKEIRFVDETIKVSIAFASAVLSAESIRSIFGGLNSEVTGQTLTLSRNAVKKAFETSEGANDGDTSAEWLALKDSKPNWTITLS